MGKKTKYFDVILGLFVAFGLVVLVSLVFLIGRQRRIFDTRVQVTAHFPNVAGLAVGADVMLSGVVVGYVSEINFPILRVDMPNLVRDITITMRVSRANIAWIREDSVARIDSKGLLGDRLINISIGSPDLPQVQPGSMLKSSPPLDLNKSLEQAQKILENVTETVSDVRKMFKGFIEEGGELALANSAKSVQRILKEVETGDGVLHELIFDKKSGRDIKETFSNIENVTKSIRTGPNLAHSLFYDEKGQQAIESLSMIIKEIETGSGILHDVIYAKDEGQFIQSLNKAAKDIESITGDLKDGKGSLGLLLKDPSLYNASFELLGNLSRNRLLKAVIRSNISQGDKKNIVQ